MTRRERRIGIVGWVAIVVLGAACGDRPRPPPPPPSATTPVAEEPATLDVFAAASLRDVSESLAAAFARHGRPALRFNFAGSNVLARQIVSSDRGDVFLSADERWADEIDTAGRAVPGTKRWFLSNTLVVIAHPSATYTLASPAALASLRFAHLALADPESVPAGRYAKAYLESLPQGSGTVWTAVAPRVAPAADVRAALALVAADASTVGIVYRTDASAAAVRTLATIPADDLPTKVRYYALAVSGRAHVAESTEFVEFLGSREARAIFESAGFLVPDAVP